MTPRLAFIALMTLPLAACDGANLPGLGGAQPQVQGHQGPPGVSPLEQPIETGAEVRPVSTAEAATYNTAAFSARGNEPFWAVDVAGSTAIYKTPDNQRGRPIRVNRLNFAQGVEYVGVHAGRPFVLNIRATECQDSMSGQDFPFTARLTVSGSSNTGCAGPATAEVAQAVAATRAPAPAAPRRAQRRRHGARLRHALLLPRPPRKRPHRQRPRRLRPRIRRPRQPRRRRRPVPPRRPPLRRLPRRRQHRRAPATCPHRPHPATLRRNKPRLPRPSCQPCRFFPPCNRQAARPRPNPPNDRQTARCGIRDAPAQA